MADIELTASNIAACMLATVRSAGGGSIARAVTNATAFSFQSVITSAAAGATPLKMMTGTIQRSLHSMDLSIVGPSPGPGARSDGCWGAPIAGQCGDVTILNKWG